jgi:hypothetical protein
MSKYKNARFLEEDQETDVITKEFKEELNIQNEEPKNDEEATFKKRYSDLRRHQAEKEREWQEKFNTLQRQLQDASSKQMKLPKSEEELEDWVTKYPDVAGIVETLIAKRVQEGINQANERFSELDQLKADLTFKEAVMRLQEAHPDFPEIQKSQEFRDWLEDARVSNDGSEWVYEALVENTTDWKRAAKAIAYYKATSGLTDKKENKSGAKSKEAASSVKTPRSNDSPSSSEYEFTESQIQKMSAQDYEKNEQKIREAMRNGRVLMDISGGAR